MNCSRGKASPDSITRLRLFADSGGYCQKPGCGSELFRDIEGETFHIAEMAHIISASDNGPRSDETKSLEERGDYNNLVLLCPTCHTVVDKADQYYPEVLLLEWKRNHKEKVAALFGYRALSSRTEGRSAILPFLRENKTIFDQYGPMTEGRYDPESGTPSQWLRKIRTRIIPNNRKILAICDFNATLLVESEIATLELFRQHVEDFEAKHLENFGSNGSQFPAKMNDMFETGVDR